MSTSKFMMTNGVPPTIRSSIKISESEPMTEARVSPDEARTVVAFLRPSAGAGNGGGNIGDGRDGRGGGDGGGDYWVKFILEQVRGVYDRVEQLLKEQNAELASDAKDTASLVRELASDAKENAVLIKMLSEQNCALGERVAKLERGLAAFLPSDARS